MNKFGRGSGVPIELYSYTGYGVEAVVQHNERQGSRDEGIDS
ncbi:hypothetical protein [Paenibacillus yonginensis]|nr:hypothetical protein [Paenibacillus yonginensis]